VNKDTKWSRKEGQPDKHGDGEFLGGAISQDDLYTAVGDGRGCDAVGTGKDDGSAWRSSAIFEIRKLLSTVDAY
jgi:hypothetical protein